MKKSGLWRRLGAIIYDTLLVLALLFLVTIPFIAIRGGEPVDAADNLPYQLCLAIVVYGFFVGFWARSGRTLGMQSWGLQLQNRDGRIPSISQASIRFFAAIVSWLAVGLGFLWQLWDKDQLTWHDRISCTCLMHYPKPGKDSSV